MLWLCQWQMTDTLNMQVMPLQWPAVGPLQAAPGAIQLGIAVEPLGRPLMALS